MKTLKIIDQDIGDQKARMIFTDPPYNVPIPGHVSGKGQNKHKNFAMASGEMGTEEFTAFLHDAFKEMVSYIPQDLWDAVQEKLISQATAHRGHKKAHDQNLLKGLLFDCEDTPYSPHFTTKGKKCYRYYISQNLIQYRDHPKGTMARIPAHEIEKVVMDTIRNGLIEILELNQIGDHELIEHIMTNSPPAEKLARSSINKITVNQDTLHIDVSAVKLRQAIQKYLNLNIQERYNRPNHVLSVPFTTRRSYKGAVIINPKNSDYDPFDLSPYQLRNLVRGITWRDEHFSGMAIKEIAAHEKLSESGIRKIIMASFDILQAA